MGKTYIRGGARTKGAGVRASRSRKFLCRGDIDLILLERLFCGVEGFLVLCNFGSYDETHGTTEEFQGSIFCFDGIQKFSRTYSRVLEY